MAKVVKLVEVSPENFMVVLSGTERLKINRIRRLGMGVLEAHGVALEDAEPDRRVPPLLLEAAEQMLHLAIQQDNLADDALEVLRQLPSHRLADCAAEIFSGMLDQALRADVLQSQDPSGRLMLVVDALGSLRMRTENGLDRHDGDLHAARLAIYEDELNGLKEDVSGIGRAVAGG